VYLLEMASVLQMLEDYSLAQQEVGAVPEELAGSMAQSQSPDLYLQTIDRTHQLLALAVEQV
jgi:conjugal transfer/entry exclusion protein